MAIEGNIVQGVSRTLWEEVKFDNKTVTSVDWLTYPILDITETPETIESVLINHPEIAPTGAGEPSTRPVAAAIANAIFDATGVRIRRVPFSPDHVKGRCHLIFTSPLAGEACERSGTRVRGTFREFELSGIKLRRWSPLTQPSPRGRGEGVAGWRRVYVAMPMIARTLDEALAPIVDGCLLAVPRESSGVPMAATRALIRRGVKHLHLVTLPTSTLQADLLIGAGCIATLETSAVSLGEFGPAPRFNAAILGGAIRMLDATCPALHAQFQAAEKGVPFMPLRGLIGSDVLAQRPDWKVIDNPFGQDFDSDPIVLLPALKPDVALVSRAARRPRRQCFHRHPARTDRDGACRGNDHRHRRANCTTAICCAIRRSPPARCRAFMSRRSRSSRAAPGRCRCRITTASMPPI